MQKLIFFILFALIVFNADLCYSQGASGRFDKNEVSKIKKSLSYDSIQLTPEEKEDDSAWPDGTIPSTWTTAGFQEPLQFKRFLKYLRILVKNDKRKEIVRFINYSLLETKSATKNIKNENDFLKNYDKLFNNKVKTALENQDLSEIFRNYMGAMIGNGELWFEETKGGGFKITSINF